MAKKIRDYTLPFNPPVSVKVSLVDSDSALARATAALNQQKSDADRAADDAVEAERAKLASSVTAARASLDALRAFEKDNASDLTLLRSLSFDQVRGVKMSDEAMRVAAEKGVRDFLGLLAHLRGVLTNTPERVAALKPGDLRGPRMTSSAPGIRAYADLPYAATARIELDQQRASRAVAVLPARLAEVKNAVTALYADVEKKRRVREREAAVATGATIVDPAELERRAAFNPNVPAQTSYGNFPVYEADRT